MIVMPLFRKPSSRTVRWPMFRPRLTALEDRAVPSFGWAADVGGTTNNAVATDAAGDVYMVGSSIAKYSRDGSLLWSVNLDGADIAVDGTGSNVYVVGESSGAGFTTNLDGATGAIRWTLNGQDARTVSVDVDGSGSAYTTGSGSGGGTVTKFDSSGNQQWQTTMTGATPMSVAVSGSSVYVGGTYGPNATITTGSSNATISGSSFFCGFVLNLNTSNDFVWAKTFQGTLKGTKVQGFLPLGMEVAADNSGSVYATGNFFGTVNFANSSASSGAFVLIGHGNGSAFVTKLAPSGSVTWAKKFGDSGRDYTQGALVNAIAVDGVGAVYLTGSFGRTTSFNPAGGGNLTSAGGPDVFVSKLNSGGSFEWAVRAGAAGADEAHGIAVNGDGDINVAGLIGGGTVDFDLTQSYFDNRDLLTSVTSTGFLWQIRQL